jgi:hypothetical protein
VSSYTAVIDLKVNGGDELKKVNDNVATLQRLVNGIKPPRTLFDRRIDEEGQKVQKELSALVKAYAAPTKAGAQFSTSIAGLNSQLSTFKRITSNAKVGSDEFNNSIIAGERASRKLIQAEQERLQVLRQIYTGPTSKAGATGTMQSSGLEEVYAIAKKTIPTIAGITEQIRVLETALENIDIGTPIFKSTENLIAQRQALLQNIRLEGQTSKLPQMATHTPIQMGPSGAIPTTLQGIKAQSAYYSKVESLQYKQLVTGQQIAQSSINETQQQELQNRLAQAHQTLLEGDLQLATRMTTELKGQRIYYERINKDKQALMRPSSMVAGAAEPISGRRVGGTLVPGSPAAKAAEAEANRKATDAAIALGQQKLRALEQEAAELRKGTSAAVALAQQKQKALDQEASEQRKATSAAVSLAQQKLREEERQQKLLDTLSKTRQSGAVKSQVFGTLGTSFLPVTGKLPGGELVPGSPAAKTAEAAAAREQTQAAVALSQQKAKALEQEAEQLRKGTSAAVALSNQKTKAVEEEAKAERARTNAAVALGQQQLKEEERQQRQLEQLTRTRQAGQTGAGKPQVFGTLGTSFLPVTGKMPGGELVSGSPAAKAAESTAINAALTQEAANRTRVAHLINSSQLLEQGILKEKAKGLDLDVAQQRIQQVINHLNQYGLNLDKEQLKTADNILNGLRHELKLKKAIAATDAANNPPSPGQAKPGKGKGTGAIGDTNRMESLALGVGFPLMFGAGPASLAGSLAGSFIGTGFGGQILGGAIGGIIDKAVQSVQNLDAAFRAAGDDYSALRETGLQFSAELERQVQAAKSLGEYTKAQALANQALSTTGDIGGGTEGVAASVNRLGAAWNKVKQSVSLLTGVALAPFIEVLTMILELVNLIAVAFNYVIGAVSSLIKTIPGVAAIIDAQNNAAYATTAEYQNQLAELDKQIESSTQLNKISKAKLDIENRALGKTAEQRKQYELRAQVQEKELELAKQISEFRKQNPIPRTSEQQNKQQQVIGAMRSDANMKIQSILQNAYTNLFDEITQQNITINNQKKDQELSFRDMVRETARIQQDLNTETARKAQDLRIQVIEKENQLIKQQADLRVKAMELESTKRLGVLRGQVAANPDLEPALKVQTILDDLKIGLAKIDNEAADKQRQAKLSLIKLDIENERYKYDTAVRINRLNIDNQNKIARINEQINRQNEAASRTNISGRLKALQLETLSSGLQTRSALRTYKTSQKAPGINPADALTYQNQIDDLNATLDELRNLYTKIDEAMKIAPPKLPNVQQLATVSANTGPVSTQYNALQQQIQTEASVAAKSAELDRQKEIENSLNESVALGNESLATVSAQVKQNLTKLNQEEHYQNLLKSGTNPALAEQLATNYSLYKQAQLTYKTTIKALQDQKETYPTLIPFIENTITLLQQQTDLLDEQYTILQNTTAELDNQAVIRQAQAIQRQTTGVEAGMRSGFIGQAQGAYATAITEGRTPQQAELLAQQTQALELATTKARALESAYQDIGTAMATTLTEGVAGLVAGTTTAQQVFSDFLKGIGDALMKAAQQMIAQYLAIAAAKALAGLFGGGGGGGGFSLGGEGSGSGGAVGSLGSAMSPTSALPSFMAAGGPVTSNTPYIVGEKGPELFVPSSSGSIVPADRTAAMARYQRQTGATGGASGGAEDQTAMGNGLSPSIDVSYTVERINSVSYVTDEQFQVGLRQAAKQGATLGRQQVMSDLSNKRSVRSRLGL